MSGFDTSLIALVKYRRPEVVGSVPFGNRTLGSIWYWMEPSSPDMAVMGMVFPERPIWICCVVDDAVVVGSCWGGAGGGT